MKSVKLKYFQSDIEKVFQTLISNWDELMAYYQSEINTTQLPSIERLVYLEISDIARFILKKKNNGDTKHLESFFINVEEVLNFGDNYVQELIVIGLFESLQNNSQTEDNTTDSFDCWLQTNSLVAWKDLIQFWNKE